MTHPATDLRNTLVVTARAAYLDGATDRQIDLIVALARGSNRYEVMSGGRLTKLDAMRIISDMMESGAEADYNKTEAELDDEDAAAAEVEKIIAYKAASKKQKGEEADARKAAREAEALADATAKAATSIRRVRHAQFGEGVVVGEDAKSVTVLFEGQKKPLRMAPSFITEL